MIYFVNNMDYSASWSSAYQNLNNKYQLLAADYAKAIQLRQSLKSKIQNLEKENLELKKTKRKIEIKPEPQEDIEGSSSFDAIRKQITIADKKRTNQKIRKQPSGETETKIDGHSYECTYEGCHRVYSSPVSMNLHIKMKHNGGTKKQRQAFARILIQAEQRGQEPPKMNINLPPNFLQQYRTSYEYMKKYSM